MDKKYLITTLVSALIGITTGVVTNRINNWLTAPRAGLEYRSEKAIPFEVGNESIAIYYSTIRNSGNAPIENIYIQQNVPDAEVDKGRVETPPGVTHADQIAPSGLTTNVSNLNPEESVSASILVKSKSALPEKPALKVRARGASATETDYISKDDGWRTWLPALIISSLFTALAFLIIFSWRSERTFKAEQPGASAPPDASGIMLVTLDFNKGIDWPSLLQKTKRLDVFIVFGRTWREGNLPHLQKLSERKSTIRLILPDFENRKLMDDLANRFGMEAEQVVRDIRETASRFKQLFPGPKAQLQVWLHNRAPTYTYYRVDSACIITSYRHRLGKGEIPTLQLRPGGSLANFYDDEFSAFAKEESKYARLF